MKRLFKLLFLPAIIFLWFIGWSLLWIGTRRQHKKKVTE